MTYEYSAAEEIADISIQRPHLVILGAGASVAACPRGDANGRQLPVMLDFVHKLGLNDLLESSGIATSGNFEDIYAGVCELPEFDDLRQKLEQEVHRYFSALQLVDTPTIYDHLILSLRPKDVIATFNWDPFLCQALARTRHIAPIPKVLFLHGNVAISLCPNDKKAFILENRCSVCGRSTIPTKLLYPIREKHYSADPFISAQWHNLRVALRNAFLLTIFGYGAPISDTEAVQLMSEAWGRADDRQLEQIELINIIPEEQLVGSWNKFIHTHHYDVVRSLYDSWIAKHPRRSCEAAWQQIVEAKFIDENPIPADATFDDLEVWIRSVAAHENA